MRVLIVEDEAHLAKNIAKALRETASFATDISTDGEDGLHMARSNPYDLIILDLMLPKINGLEILKKLRSEGQGTPVLILTARDRSDDIINGLDLGCDDYLTKPFNIYELIARCKALVRRAYNSPNPVLCADELVLNTATRRVTFQDKPITLVAMEYRLLEYLMLRSGQIVTKAEIIDHLYCHEAESFSNLVEVYISSLRKKIDPGPQRRLIHTVRGQGYFIGEVPC
jgi:two-component system response regulator PhoP